MKPPYLIKKSLRFVVGFLILLSIQLFSEWLLNILNFNFPPVIFGMIMFALLLNFKIISLKLVKDICNFMISILPSLFVPLLVGITVYWGIIRQNFLGILLSIIFATFITMILTAVFVDKVMEWTGKKNV